MTIKRFSTSHKICKCQRCNNEVEVHGVYIDLCINCQQEVEMITTTEIDCIDFKEKCPHCKADNSEIEPRESFDHGGADGFVEWKDLFTCPHCNKDYIVIQHN